MYLTSLNLKCFLLTVRLMVKEKDNIELNKGSWRFVFFFMNTEREYEKECRSVTLVGCGWNFEYNCVALVCL